MSFDVFVLRLKEPLLYKRSIFMEILGSNAIFDRSGGLYEARFSDNDWATIYGAEEEDMDGIMFQGGGEKFMQAVWELADRTQSFIFWPAESNNYVVANEATLTQVDPDFLEKIRPVRIVKNGQEITDAIITS